MLRGCPIGVSSRGGTASCLILDAVLDEERYLAQSIPPLLAGLSIVSGIVIVALGICGFIQANRVARESSMVQVAGGSVLISAL